MQPRLPQIRTGLGPANRHYRGECVTDDEFKGTQREITLSWMIRPAGRHSLLKHL